MIRRVIGGVGANIFDKLIIAGSQLVMVPVMVTHWGIPTYGLWVLFSTIPAFLAVSDFGFATAAGTTMTMAVARGDREGAVQIFHSGWIAVLLTSTVMITLALMVVWWLPVSVLGNAPHLSPDQVRPTLTLLLFYGIAALQGSIFFAGFRCAGLFAVGAFWNALIILLESSAAVTVVLLGGAPTIAAAALFLGRILGLIGQNLLLRHRVPWLKIGVSRASIAEARALIPPAFAVMMLPLAQACLLQGNAWALGLAAGKALLPAFTATRTLSRVGLQMCWLLSSALMPEFSAASAREDRRGMALMLLVTIATSALLVIPYAGLFALFGGNIVQLWTGGMLRPSQGLILTMAGTILFGGFWYPISNLILALNRHAAYTYAFVALALTSIVISYLLALSVGALGAGIGMLILDISMFLIITRQASHMIANLDELIRLSSALPAQMGRIVQQIRTRAR